MSTPTASTPATTATPAAPRRTRRAAAPRRSAASRRVAGVPKDGDEAMDSKDTYFLYNPADRRLFAKVKATNYYRAALKAATKNLSKVWVRRANDNLVKVYRTSKATPKKGIRKVFRYTGPAAEKAANYARFGVRGAMNKQGTKRIFPFAVDEAAYEAMRTARLGTIIEYKTEPQAYKDGYFYTKMRARKDASGAAVNPGAWTIELINEKVVDPSKPKRKPPVRRPRAPTTATTPAPPRRASRNPRN